MLYCDVGGGTTRPGDGITTVPLSTRLSIMATLGDS